jgi:hypothetical protein
MGCVFLRSVFSAYDRRVEFDAIVGNFWGNSSARAFGVLGYCIIAIFALSWIASIVIYKVRRFEEFELAMKPEQF